MSKKKVKEFEAWANKELAKWQKILLLDSFSLKPIKPSPDESSKCAFRYPYREILIMYSSEVIDDWAKGDKHEATGVLVHELFHVVTDPFYAKATSRFLHRDEVEDQREQLVEHLSNIVMKNLLK